MINWLLLCSGCSSECIQQLQKEKQQLEKQLMDAKFALREAEAERQKHDETKKQRDALTAQTEVRLRLVFVPILGAALQA